MTVPLIAAAITIAVCVVAIVITVCGCAWMAASKANRKELDRPDDDDAGPSIPRVVYRDGPNPGYTSTIPGLQGGNQKAYRKPH